MTVTKIEAGKRTKLPYKVIWFDANGVKQIESFAKKGAAKAAVAALSYYKINARYFSLRAEYI